MQYTLQVQGKGQVNDSFSLDRVDLFSLGLCKGKWESVRTPVVLQKPHFLCDSSERVNEGVSVRAVNFTLHEELQLISGRFLTPPSCTTLQVEELRLKRL